MTAEMGRILISGGLFLQEKVNYNSQSAQDSRAGVMPRNFYRRMKPTYLVSRSFRA